MLFGDRFTSDPYADPYGDSTGWKRRFVADYDLRVFREKGQKSPTAATENTDFSSS